MRWFRSAERLLRWAEGQNGGFEGSAAEIAKQCGLTTKEVAWVLAKLQGLKIDRTRHTGTGHKRADWFITLHAGGKPSSPSGAEE